MKLNDLDKLKEIAALSFSKIMRFFAVKSLLSDEGAVLVSEEKGVVVGFVKLIDFEIAHVRYGCILWIAVHPSYRRRGVAKALAAEGIKRLKQGGATTLFASVQRRKTGAQIVLKQNGFRIARFLEVWRLFGWRVFQFYGDIWLAPGEVVLVHD
jgi:ribosomal protein S18 acetylase RimI-like enzyme